ncbi:kelch-like protein 10 [Teleopsis dalmanni]|uniref:kelch-like protein 10 n=1 Tax=Teleopsis dalmanni TaxID=139649 RepID=UPI0018CCE385|nr:kelch-like protein 10 [Teleopsis dalmanni]
MDSDNLLCLQHRATNDPGCAQKICRNSKKSVPKTLYEMGYRNSIPNWKNAMTHRNCEHFEELQKVFRDSSNGDVEVKVGNCTFKCHRLILRAYSNYFNAHPTVSNFEISDDVISPIAFRVLYDWMTDNSVRINCDGVMEVIKAAIYFEVPLLMEFCWKIFSNEAYFCEDVAFMVYLEARSYDFPELKEVMLTRVRKFYLQLTCTAEFLFLTAEELKLLIFSNYIEVNMESEVFLSVVRWLDHCWEERSAFLVPLMQCIRFSTMPASFLLYLTRGADCEEVRRVIENNEVITMIKHALEFVSAKISCPIRELPALLAHLNVPYKPRNWIFDPRCSYHHRNDCNKMEELTYYKYLCYLQYLQNASPNHWSTLIPANDLKARCCYKKKQYNSDNETICCSKSILSETTSDTSTKSTSDDYTTTVFMYETPRTTTSRNYLTSGRSSSYPNSYYTSTQQTSNSASTERHVIHPY